MPLQYRGRILYGDYFVAGNFGGGLVPPLGIPKLQLHHAQPNMQVNAVRRVINSCKSNFFFLG